MITLKNLENGEMMQVWQTGIDKETGRIYCNGTPTEKYLTKYPLTSTGETRGEKDTFLTVNEGWELVKKQRTTNNGEPKAPRKTRTKKAEPQPAAEPVIENEPAAIEETVDTVETAIEEPVVIDEAEPVDEGNGDDTCNEQALIAAIKNLRGGAVDVTKVRQIVAEELAKLAKEEPTKAAAIRKKIAKTNNGTKEVYCKKFERILAKVSRGHHVYLYGRAGTGKSHTGEQVAEKLGLKFYGQTTVQFAHDVRGYGDAGGNYQETPFFKAFSEGGLYFQDEYDRSQPDAAIVLNTALANGYYDFPIVGRVEMHPDFRFMAAGNTLMKGAQDGYVTGNEQDASSRDRFGFFFEVDYSHEVEMTIAHGNAEIVSFVEDVRKAIKSCGIEHVVSYRATKCMIDEVENENDKKACLEECVFKALGVDEIREIYYALGNKSNEWAVIMQKLF